MDYMEALTVLVTLLACMGPILHVFIYMIPKNFKGWFIFFLFIFFPVINKSIPQPLVF